ncbi:Secreted protein [Pseudomonas sp. IT-P4]
MRSTHKKQHCCHILGPLRSPAGRCGAPTSSLATKVGVPEAPRLSEQHYLYAARIATPLSSIAKSLTLNVKQPACT